MVTEPDCRRSGTPRQRGPTRFGQHPGRRVRRRERRLLEFVRRACKGAESDEGSGIPMAQRKSAAPLVGVVMGSESDWDTMKHAAAQLDAFGVPYEARVLSAHRMPDDMFEYAEDALTRGLRCIVAGAGGAAHLPGMLAAKTTVPVLGVPVPSKYLRGEDSLYSIVQLSLIHI